MGEKGLFFQNVIAVVWDFDKTLSPEYMQKPLFEAYDVDEELFWSEVQALPKYYARAGIHVHPDTCYLGHLLSYVKHGRLPGLTNAKLEELGGSIAFYPGIPGFFERLKKEVRAPEFREGDLEIELEHYVVSCGLKAMVKGSGVAPWLDGIWASEFIECPAGPGADLKGAPSTGAISQIAGFLDNTTKTRALFEINKGVNKSDRITVNDSIEESERRVPFKNMIYIADGPSDIPSFSVVKKHGGTTYAVYGKGDRRQYDQVNDLHDSDRVDFCGEADYREDSPTDMWLRRKVRNIAERIMKERRTDFAAKVKRGPGHLHEDDE